MLDAREEKGRRQRGQTGDAVRDTAAFRLD